METAKRDMRRMNKGGVAVYVGVPAVSKRKKRRVDASMRCLNENMEEEMRLV
ncbi:hypothetical protein A2U01_0065337 [Trifolium medium]|uniref:Uncharacterized protein n=1 Tax=Trifolium medium TaxID=97028 RepID=A0A392S5J6_9FABA|nr:hypothetical protein [Trifolium medium]